MLVVLRVEKGLNGQVLLRDAQLLQKMFGPHDGNAVRMDVGNQHARGVHERLPELPKRPHVQRLAGRAIHNILGARNLPNLVGNVVEKPG